MFSYTTHANKQTNERYVKKSCYNGKKRETTVIRAHLDTTRVIKIFTHNYGAIRLFSYNYSTDEGTLDR